MDEIQTSADADLEIVFDASEFTTNSVKSTEGGIPELREPDISMNDAVGENGDEGQPEEIQNETVNLMETKLSAPAAVAVLSFANANGLQEVIPNASLPDITITPVTKCVRRRRRKRFFSSNPANTVAYRTRTVTKAKLASKESGNVQESKLVAAPIKNVQSKSKTLDARNSNSELPEGDVRSSRKRNTKKPTQMLDQPEQKRERFIDLDRPGSVLGQINIRSILNKQTFDLLPSLYQYKLLQLLPDVDTVVGPDNASTPSTSAFNNEFFAKACEEWKTRLMAGEFTPEQIQKNRQEAERDKSKLDPWKVKYFEPVWGTKAPTSQNSKPPKTSVGENALSTSKPSLELHSASPVALISSANQEEGGVLTGDKVSQPGAGRGQDLGLPGNPPQIEIQVNSDQTQSRRDSLTSPSRSTKRVHPSINGEDQLQDKRGRLSVEPFCPELKHEPCPSSSIGTPEVLKPETVAKQQEEENKLVGLPPQSLSPALEVKSVEHVASEDMTIVKTEDVPADAEEEVATNFVRGRNASDENLVRSGGGPLHSQSQVDSNAREESSRTKSVTQAGQPDQKAQTQTVSDVQSPSNEGGRAEDHADQAPNVNQPELPSEIPKFGDMENANFSQVIVGTSGTVIPTVDETKGDCDGRLLESVPQTLGVESRSGSGDGSSNSMSTESISSHVQIFANQSDCEGNLVHATATNGKHASLVQSNQAMEIHRKARPKAKQGKLTRTPSAPPGSVNLERSYQICQAVIQNSPNREQLQNQLVKPPPVLVTSKADASLAGYQQQFSLSTQPPVTQPQRRGSTPALVQATQLPPHVQLLRPHQKLILTHISGSPPNKQLGVSAHPIMAHPQLGPSGLSALPILKPVQASNPVLLQSGAGKPLLQSQQSHTPATSSAPAATVITSQQLAMLIQQQQRQGAPAVLQPLAGGGRNTGLINSVTTSRCDAVSYSQQAFTCAGGITARSISSLPPHIKIISSQYLHRVPSSAVSSLPNSAPPSLPSLNQVVRIPIQRQGGKPSPQGNLPIRAKIINSVGETLTIHRAPTSLQQIDFNSTASVVSVGSSAGGSKDLSHEFAQRSQDSQHHGHSSNQSVAFPSKVRVIRAIDNMGLIPQTNKNGAPVLAQANGALGGGASVGSSLAEFVTSQLAASNIRPISPLGVEHKQNVSFMSTGVRSNSPCPRNDQVLGATLQAARPQTNNGGSLAEGGQGALLQGFSNSDDLGLVPGWVGVNGEQEVDLAATLDSPYSFISEAELGSVAETIDVTTKTTPEGDSGASGSSKQMSTVYFAGSSGWDGSCLASSGDSSSDPIMFVSPSYELGAYVTQKAFPSPASFPKSRTSLTPADALGKAGLEHKGGGGNQHGQAGSTSRFESPASQAPSDGLRQQYIIVQATGSNGLPTNLAVPTNSLLLSSPVLMDQKRDLQNDNSNAVAGMQPGNFSIGLDGSNCEAVTVAGVPTANHLQGGQSSSCPISIQSQLGMDVKVVYASTASGDGNGLACVQTSAPSQGQYMLNSFVNQTGPVQYKVSPSNQLRGPSLITVPMSTQLQRHPPAQSISSGQNIIHIQSPALLGQQIGNRIVNVGLKAQNTWSSSGIVNVMNSSATVVTAPVADTTQSGVQGAQQLHNLNVLEGGGGASTPLNVKVVQLGGNGNVVSAGMDRLAILPKPSARGDCPAPRLEHIVLDKKGNCICDLRAMVMCRKCGVFCHDDCMGATNLCMTCTIR